MVTLTAHGGGELCFQPRALFFRLFFHVPCHEKHTQFRVRSWPQISGLENTNKKYILRGRMSHLALRLRGGVEYGFRERIKL